MWVAFAFAKATHIFLQQNTRELDIVLIRTVNILTTNELVKLMMLWTTGPDFQFDGYFFNPFMPSGLLYLNSLESSISNKRGVCLFLLSPCFIEVSVFNADCVDTDQMPRSAASDQGLHNPH